MNTNIKRLLAEKSFEHTDITDGQLAKINRYTRRELTKDEVFVFSVVLCDNEIDRDFERFSKDSLDKLAELYIGKTGVFDHKVETSNQSARVFETEVQATGELNSLGSEYAHLKAWAYMVRCEKNADLILEIDAGIKKEVSVGCAVEKLLCSVCGADQRQEPCAHAKGREYSGMVCHHVLTNPTDAYEWSFVAVPAQKNAGVVKGFMDKPSAISGEVTLEKLFDRKDDIILTASQMASLEGEYIKLKALAAEGEARILGLRKDMIRNALLAEPELDGGVIEQVAEKMNPAQLAEFARVFGKSAAKHMPVRVQLAGSRRDGEPDTQFKI